MLSFWKSKKIIAAGFILAAIAVLSYWKSHETSASSSDNLSGWAWSETIGWISFNSTNQGGGASYGATVANNGDISGYAWSENIGWISFNETSGCPSSPCAPKMNRGSGEVSGWARACAGTVNGDCTGASRSDGWDGWIHLKGTNYGVTASGCSWDGYAWGSEVMGWIHFKGTNYGVTGTGYGCVAPPTPQPPGSSCGVNPDCQSNICQSGTCVSGLAGPCTSTSQCQTGLICISGACATTPQCQDGTDNDNDGKIDLNDPGCASSSDNDEQDLSQPIFQETNP